MNYVYVVYDYYDCGAECISIHETPESAITGLQDAGNGKIAKVWFGKPFKEEIAKWEGRTPAGYSTRVSNGEEEPIERQAVHLMVGSSAVNKTACGLDIRLIDGLTVADNVAGTTCEACKKELNLP
jgi:hypothetical protein